MKIPIEFRRVHFTDEEMTKFSHFTEWGVNVGANGASFTSPSSNNYALYHYDEQFTGITDKNGVKIFTNDLRIDSLGKTFRIYQTEGGFAIKAYFWCDDINDLTESDALILTPLVDAQTRDWLKNSTTHVGNIYDKN